MGNQIIWSRSALRDLREAIEYIARDSKIYADRFRLEVRFLAERLNKFSLRGRIVPELERNDVREVIFGAYRMIYVLQDDQVYIAAFIHGARNLGDSNLDERLTDD